MMGIPSLADNVFESGPRILANYPVKIQGKSRIKNAYITKVMVSSRFPSKSKGLDCPEDGSAQPSLDFFRDSWSP